MRRLACAVMAAALVLTACSGSDRGGASASPMVGDISLIQIGVSDTAAPSLTWPHGIPFTTAQTKVVLQGDGALLQDGQPILFDFFAQSLETNEVIRNTYDLAPQSSLLAPELLGEDLYNILLTARVGTRVLSVVPSTGEFDEQTALAVVIDILPDRATGKALPDPKGLPKVTSSATGEPMITLTPPEDLPVELTTALLIQGEGEQIREGSFIVAQFKAVYAEDGAKGETEWVAGDVRQSTWPPAQAPLDEQIGKGRLLRAWEDALIDQTAGSRVLVVAPEAWAYPGEGTLVYVIDILDVRNADQ